MSRALLTDLYQLTMAAAYRKTALHEREAVFHLFFRREPFGSGFAIAAGLAQVVELLENLRFDDVDVDYLRSLGLFDEPFLTSLRSFRFACDVDAIPEGTAVFAHEPLVRVRGPLLQAQLVETALLNIVNFQTLIATKAARIVYAAQGREVLEFGLRRAQGPDGGLTASRAAFLGGCSATSNVLAGHRFGIPVRGTHAHSWVMAFDDERAAFAAWADAMPHNALFLVDTYDTLDGVRHAIEIAPLLGERGGKLLGIRLDSGDLAWLSIEARRLLDEAGLTGAQIVATNDLDEELIASLLQQGARIDVFGVGTKLATAYDQPALGGVYKLGALREDGAWSRRIKVSEQAVKTSIPGILNVRRFASGGESRGDMLWDELDGSPETARIIDPANDTRSKSLDDCEARELLVPIFRGGERVYEVPPLAASRDLVQRELASLHDGIKRLKHPHEYPVGLEERLHARRKMMIRDAAAE
ncbi:MAG: nicotinate phosphoribosyltransferase [Acidobacteria bacterium]|nr:nicotinate phosphoribosyltransferase [Acidobacteriota bacterium]